MKSELTTSIASDSVIRIDPFPDSDTILIAFSGMRVERFNFVYASRRLPVYKIFVRDPYDCWYQCGISDVADSIDKTADYFARLIDEHRFRRVVLTGVSAGGYAALLFGWLLNVDEVHAVAPRCFLDLRNRIAHSDFRAFKYVERLYGSDRPQREYFDLKPLFATIKSVTTVFHIYYSETSPLDWVHATHVKGFPGIVLHPFEEGGHVTLGMRLARDGTLERTFARALGLVAPCDPRA